MFAVFCDALRCFVVVFGVCYVSYVRCFATFCVVVFGDDFAMCFVLRSVYVRCHSLRRSAVFRDVFVMFF